MYKKLDQRKNLRKDETKRKQQGEIPDRTKEEIDIVDMYILERKKRTNEHIGIIPLMGRLTYMT